MKLDLIQYLQRRESIIADHSWRDRDAAGHLEALKDVSGKISGWIEKHGSQCDARLRHYLTNASFAKALAHLQSDLPR